MRWLALLLIASGCGRFGFLESEGTAADAGSDTTIITPDMAPYGDAAPCVLGPWSQPVVITTGFSALAYDPNERFDRLELFLTSGGGPSYDVKVSTRASVNDPYPDAVEIPGLNSVDFHDSNPSLTEDALTLFFTSERSGTRRAYVATRATLASPWGAPVLVPGLESASMDSIDITPDGLSLYISRTNVEFTVARRISPAVPFGAEQVVNAEPVPYMSVSADELEVYASAGTAIDVRTRSSVLEPFGPPVSAGSFFGGDPDISHDGRRLLMAGPATIEQSDRACQ